MFTELTDDLLDLTATEKGAGLALYAASDGDQCSSSCGTLVLCCTCWICF